MNTLASRVWEMGARLRRWWLIGLSGLASLAAPESATPPQFRVWLHLAEGDHLDNTALAGLLPELKTDEVVQRLQQAGKAVVWTGTQEEAEWHAECLRASGMQATVAYQLSRWE